MRVAAFNNNYHHFTSTEPLDADFAVVEFLGISYTLYPNVEGLFSLDTKSFSKDLFSFSDSYDYTGNLIDDNQFAKLEFNIRIFLNDTSIENSLLNVTFFNGAINRIESTTEVQDGIVNFSDLRMPYFEGFPFEYSEVNGNQVNRVLVSNGFNFIPNTNVRTIQNDCGGFYLKFHNGKWGYSYYLFEPIGIEKLQVKSLGDLKEQFSWTDNYLEIGKTGQRQLDIFSYVDYEDRELIKRLALSNEVYLYTGKKGDVANDCNWLEVKVKLDVDETNKNSCFPQEVTVYLPKDATRTRI